MKKNRKVQDHLEKKYFSKNNLIENDARIFYTSETFFNQKNNPNNTKVELTKTEIEKMASNFILPT